MVCVLNKRSEEEASSQVSPSSLDVGCNIAVEEVTQVAAKVALSIAFHLWDKTCELVAVGKRMGSR